ncbi:MAG: hypothetical protein KF687_16055 [Cyclobacteriaceae bacterium]|nr:hypothetical protein [Cyclobacteriaceae bacterium]
MKKLMFPIFALLMFTFVNVNAQDVQQPEATAKQEASQVQDEKVEIKSADLPEAVKTTLAGPDYSGWAVEAAYHIKSKDQYEVKLKKGEESKTVKLNKDGKAT